MEGTDTGGKSISWCRCNRLEGEEREQQQGCRTWSGSWGSGGPVNHALIAFNKVFKKVLRGSFSKEPRMLGCSLFIGCLYGSSSGQFMS